MAKALGVKVLRFSIGFGPRFLGFRRGETEYWIAAFPLGGYVKMAGDVGDDPEKEPPEDRGRGYLEQSPWRRLAISVAGPGMNLVFPLFVYLALAVGENGHPVPGFEGSHRRADLRHDARRFVAWRDVGVCDEAEYRAAPALWGGTVVHVKVAAAQACGLHFNK